jgi:hypothetical protein
MFSARLKPCPFKTTSVADVFGTAKAMPFQNNFSCRCFRHGKSHALSKQLQLPKAVNATPGVRAAASRRRSSGVVAKASKLKAA